MILWFVEPFKLWVFIRSKHSLRCKTLKSYSLQCTTAFTTSIRDKNINSINGFYINLQTRTVISKNVSLKTFKRYYPGGKDVSKQIAEKTLNNMTTPCIGAGCAIKSIINRPNNNNATPAPNTQDKTVPNKPITNNPGFTNKDLQKFHNESKNVYRTVPQKNSNNNNIQNPTEEKTTKTLKENESAPIVSKSVKEAALNDAIEHLQKHNASKIVDDAVGVPYTPSVQDKSDLKLENNLNNNNIEKDSTFSGVNIEVLPAIFEMPEDTIKIPLKIPEPEFTLNINENNQMYLIPVPPPLPHNKTEVMPPTKMFIKTFQKELNTALETRDSESPHFDPIASQHLKESYKNLDEKLKQQQQRNNLEIKLYEFYDLYNTKGIVALTPAILNDLKLTLQTYKEHTSESVTFITESTKNAQRLSVLLSKCNEVWKEPLLALLKEDPIKECLTINQYKREYQRCIKTLEFLRLYGENIPESFVHELFYRINLIKHNDAMFFCDTFHKKIIVLEAEGSTVDKDVYKYMSNNFEKYFKLATIDVGKSKIYELFDFKNDNYFIGQFKPYYILGENKFADSGDEVHLHFIRQITLDNGQTILISLGNFTSTKDSDTIKITNQQYINVDIPIKKEQLFRPFKFLVHINDDAITINESATKYAKTTNCEGINVQEALINAILNNKETLIKNPIRKPHIITRELLQDIAEKLSESAKQLQNDDDKKYEEKTLKEQKEAGLKRTWPIYIRHLDTIKKTLEQQEKDEKQLKKSKNKLLAKQNYEKTRKNE